MLSHRTTETAASDAAEKKLLVASARKPATSSREESKWLDGFSLGTRQAYYNSGEG